MEEFLLNYAEVHKENMEIYEELNKESLTEKYHDIGIVETIKGDPFKTNTNGKTLTHKKDNPIDLLGLKYLIGILIHVW